jgi:hypothetical protein
MSLLKEIQDGAVDAKIDVTQVLRKCRVLASRLHHDELKSWVQKELDGYPNGMDVPDYRMKPCHSKGHFVGFAGAQLKNAPIPTQNLPEQLQREITKVRFRESISALENLAATGDRDSFGSQWPPELVQAYAGAFYEDMELIQAVQVVPRNAIVSVIETVRNRVLNFALEIEAANPSAGEADPGSIPLPERVVNQIFNNYITGNVANIASGSGTFHLSSAFNIARGDDDALKRALASLGVSHTDSNELAKAIKADSPLAIGEGFGPRVSKWLRSLVTKAARGGLKVTADVATQAVTALIKSYCGI